MKFFLFLIFFQILPALGNGLLFTKTIPLQQTSISLAELSELTFVAPERSPNQLTHLSFEILLKEKTEALLILRYPSSFDSQDETYKSLDLTSVSTGHWEKMDFWLPNYQINSKDSHLSFQFNAKTLTRRFPNTKTPILIPRNAPEIEIRNIHLNFSSKNPKNEKLAMEFFASVLEIPLLSHAFLLSSLILYAIPLFLMKRKLSARFLFGFLLPFPIILLFFSLQGVNFLENQKNSRLQNATTELQQKIEEFQALNELVEEEIYSEIESLKLELKEEILLLIEENLLTKNKDLSFKERTSFEKKSLKSRHKKSGRYKPGNLSLEVLVEDISQKTGIHFFLCTDEKNFGSKIFSKVASYTALGSFFHRMLRQELKKEHYDKGSEFSLIMDTKTTMIHTTGNPRLLHDFLNNRSRLFDDNPMTYTAKNFDNLKHFWDFFVLEDLSDTQNNFAWFVFGVVTLEKYLQILENKAREWQVKNPKIQWNLFSRYLDSPIPALGSQDFVMNYSLCQMLEKEQPSFDLLFETQKPVLVCTTKHRNTKNNLVALKMDISSYFEEIRDFRNQIVLILILILILTSLFAWFFSSTITAPMLRLHKGILAIQRGELSENLPKTSRDQFGFLSDLFNEMIQGLRERETITRFLSSLVLRSLSDTRQSVREETLILFCGILNLEEILKTETQDSCANSIHEFVFLCQNEIIKAGGILDKFTGQAILALFREDYKKTIPLDLCLDVEKKILKINEKREKENLPALKVGFGLATGPVVLGHVGSLVRKDFTAIGNTVNMAARLECLEVSHEITHIFTDETTYLLHKNHYDFEALEPIFIKGKKEKQNIFRVRGKRESALSQKPSGEIL